MKAFTVQARRKFQSSITKIQKTFDIRYQFYAFIRKYLVALLRLVIEVQFIGQPRASTSYHAYTEEIVLAKVLFLVYLQYPLFRLICNVYHKE